MIAADGWRFIIPLWALSILFAVLFILGGSGWWLAPLVLSGLFALFVTYHIKHLLPPLYFIKPCIEFLFVTWEVFSWGIRLACV